SSDTGSRRRPPLAWLRSGKSLHAIVPDNAHEAGALWFLHCRRLAQTSPPAADTEWFRSPPKDAPVSRPKGPRVPRRQIHCATGSKPSGAMSLPTVLHKLLPGQLLPPAPFDNAPRYSRSPGIIVSDRRPAFVPEPDRIDCGESSQRSSSGTPGSDRGLAP